MFYFGMHLPKPDRWDRTKKFTSYIVLSNTKAGGAAPPKQCLSRSCHAQACNVTEERALNISPLSKSVMEGKNVTKHDVRTCTIAVESNILVLVFTHFPRTPSSSCKAKDQSTTAFVLCWPKNDPVPISYFVKLPVRFV
jgi:hypothetical protein